MYLRMFLMKIPMLLDRLHSNLYLGYYRLIAAVVSYPMDVKSDLLIDGNLLDNLDS